MGIFKAYDIRGIYNKDFNKEDVYKIGYFLPELLNTDKVLVGHDARLSSEEILEYLKEGITDSGAMVYSMGLSTTPMVYFATAKHNFDASVQITASHNSKEYNGFKISRTKAVPVGYDSGLAKLEEMVKSGEIKKSDRKGEAYDFNIKGEYVNYLRQYVPDTSNISIGVDCSNGMASILVKDILGETPFYIYDDLDGTFPNHEPNPLIEENDRDLQELVLKNKCDIGIIYDGDADRVVFIDEKGKFISPDLIIGVMGNYFLEKEKGSVLHDIRTSKAVTEYITKIGGTPYMWKVGHAFAKVKLKEINGIFGGELAGHYYFRDFYSCDSGMLASLIVLNVVSKLKSQGRTFSSLIDSIRKYANSGEVNFRIEDKISAMEELKEVFTLKDASNTIFNFDGYRIEFSDWWFNVRVSNTEPYLRLVVEAIDNKVLDEKLSEIKYILKKYE
jgi:phosphomannomutase